MNVISEPELVLVVRSRVLKNLHIIQTHEGKYRIAVNLKNHEEMLELVTFRKTPREWASLDRLVRHMQRKYLGIPSAILNFYSGEATR
ncbi:hypothetical protein GPY61_31575 [Massilia sp. NEAU-DD11]|uniref:Uncharacterized protein n=1 Tax=Massilia cellulosiltytica TaxID=2683234 RepID=A0A7X3G6P3_9BURK|nr:hypothetical protein [Telluria cellulosilytica]MVW64465.1 hypothetical protein [Telluria cellulosilytica]